MLIKFLLNTLAVLLVSYLLPGVTVDGFFSAFLVALVLGFLNATIRPLLIFLTIPATLLTFGVFILVVNGIVIMLADYILSDFTVDGFWWAVLFSILLWIVNSLFLDLIGIKKK